MAAARRLGVSAEASIAPCVTGAATRPPGGGILGRGHVEPFGPEPARVPAKSTGGQRALVALTRPSRSALGIELQVGLCWNESSLLSATGMNRPWVGVRIGIDDDQRRPLFDAIKRSARAELRRMSWTTATRNWSGWVWNEPGDDQDVPLFARACGNEVIEGWKTLAPRLDEVVAGTTPTGGMS